MFHVKSIIAAAVVAAVAIPQTASAREWCHGAPGTESSVITFSPAQIQSYHNHYSATDDDYDPNYDPLMRLRHFADAYCKASVPSSRPSWANWDASILNWNTATMLSSGAGSFTCQICGAVEAIGKHVKDERKGGAGGSNGGFVTDDPVGIAPVVRPAIRPLQVRPPGARVIDKPATTR